MIRFSSVRRWYFGAPGGVFRRSFVVIYASLRFLCLQESIQPTPDFFNPRLKPAQQANHSRQNLPVLHWKLARAVSKITVGYGTWWPYALCAAVYLLAAVGAWRMRHMLITRMILTTLFVDLTIHVGFFWGMEEAQLYCGHWFYVLPIFAAGAISKHGSNLPRQPE